MFPAAKRILLPSWLLALWIIAAVWTCLPDASKNSVWKIFYNSLQTSLPKVIVLSVNQQDKIQISWQIASEQTYPTNWTDPTGRIATQVGQNARTQISNVSHSIADTVLDAVPGGISVFFSIAGTGLDLIGQPHHLYRDAAWLNERLSPYARAGSYDPNSIVSNLVAAGSIIAAPGSVPARIISKGIRPLSRNADFITIPRPSAGEDLFVGLYGEARRANLKSGLNLTHTPHHSVQVAVSSTSHSLGVTINIRKELHRLTRSYGKNVDLGSNVSNLAADVWNLRNILRNAGYDRSFVNQQLKEMIEFNRKVGNLP